MSGPALRDRRMLCRGESFRSEGWELLPLLERGLVVNETLLEVYTPLSLRKDVAKV